MLKRHIIAALSFSLSFRIAHAQELPQSKSAYDSVINRLSHSKDDTSRVNALVDLSNAFALYLPDTALFYGFKALVLSRKIKYLRGEQEALFYIGFTNEGRGNAPEAMQVYLDALKIADEKKSV